MLHIDDLTFRIGGRVLFDRATAHIPPSQRVGLGGRNGAGKSTLLRLILGEAHADGGSLVVHPRARVGHVDQELADSDDSLLDRVLAADTERSALLAEEALEKDGHHIAEIHERLNAIEAHAAPARAASILSGLGFSTAAQMRPVREFSGGWRMRVALAGALFARPDLLLLDEPTNHLDLEATMWLESYLATYPGTLIVISHDRDLLNTVVQRILHLEGGKLVAYAGGYDRFERTRREKISLLAKSAAKQLEQRRAMQAFVDRFRAKASKARQAQSRLKMLERMEPPVSVVEERSITFDFPDPPALPPPLLVMEDATAGYDGKAVLSRLTLRIDMDDRIALLGANGNGKSTLAKVLAGRLPLLTGRLQKSSKLTVGYFAQHQVEELRIGDTPYQHMARVLPTTPESKVRAHLGRFGFTQAHANVPVSQLSGGEKARLLFALMTRDHPHLMILDEPTNHLDIDTREALVAALNAYQGAVILITHDPHLVELAADRLWLVADGTCSAFDGDLADYRKLLLERSREQRREARAAGDGGGDKAARKDARRADAEARRRVAPLRQAAERAEREVEALNTRKARLEAGLADPALYAGPPDRLMELRIELGETIKALAVAEVAWLEAQLAYDTAAQG
ncbi:MAG: ABC-F family ATP-binding cassette domain-containing protein [Alphaproteobacteria bacterium]|nr:ABC-F family ATP-binding cassette domain-containing protein [Alphaproteobacteria bacterium]